MTPSESCGNCLQKSKCWVVLILVAGLNFTNAALWVSFAPVNNLAATYYNVTTNTIDLLALVYFIATIPLGLAATVLIDKWGLSVGILVGAVFNLLGGMLRTISTLPFVTASLHFPLTMAGQVLAAIAQSFVLIIPTKTSETWFSGNYQTFATMVTAMANPLGVTVSSLVAPLIVKSKTDIPELNLLWGIACALFGVFAVVCMCCFKSPASTNADEGEKLSYKDQIKQLFSNKNYVVLLVALGGGVGLVSCINTVLQQMLCTKGYSNKYAGLAGALMTGVGIIGGGIASVIVDKTKRFEETAKISLLLASLAFIGFAVSLNFKTNPYVAVLCAAFGFFAFAAYPVCLELSVECTYPVDEALSSGLIIISGQIQGIVLILATDWLGKPLSPKDEKVETCTVESDGNIKPLDMNIAAFVMAGFCTLFSIGLTALFKCPYKRMNASLLKQAKIQAASPAVETVDPGDPGENKKQVVYNTVDL